jgi:tRNA threonylcarbamoyl adenosine modification protein YeaZ
MQTIKCPKQDVARRLVAVPNFLCIDTALTGSHIGLCVKDQYLGGIDTMDTRGHAETLVAQIDDLLTQHQIAYSLLDFVIVTRGAGSFAGIRVGMAAAQGLSMALNIPCYTIPVFPILAHGFFKNEPEKDQVIVLLETKRQDYYVAVLNRDYSYDVSPVAYFGDDVAALLRRDLNRAVIGDAISRFQKDHDIKINAYSGYDLIQSRVFTDFVQNFSYLCDDTEMTPLYLKEADVSVSKKTQAVLV